MKQSLVRASCRAEQRESKEGAKRSKDTSGLSLQEIDLAVACRAQELQGSAGNVQAMSCSSCALQFVLQGMMQFLLSSEHQYTSRAKKYKNLYNTHIVTLVFI